MSIKITSQNSYGVFSATYLKEVLAYRDLLYMLVKREVSVLYKQTILGFAWAVFRPVVQMLVFTVFFGKLLGVERQLDGGIPYALFSYAALVPWTYFAVSLNSSTGSLVTNRQFLTKIYFPRIIIPLTPVFSKFIDFCLAFIMLFIMLLYYGRYPNINYVFLPLLILIMITTILGASLWLSALAIQYRDVQQLMQFLSQLLMYAAPVIWPISIVPKKYLLIYGLYPMVGVIEGFRAVLLGYEQMPWGLIGMGSITALTLLISGSYYFRSKEFKFADVV